MIWSAAAIPIHRETPLWIRRQDSPRDRKAPSPLRSAGALQSVNNDVEIIPITSHFALTQRLFAGEQCPTLALIRTQNHRNVIPQ
jgi:hypothetical protein